MGDKEDAVAAVEAAFHDAHKSAEKAVMDAAQLLQAWIRAGRAVGVHPNESGSVGATLGDAIGKLSDASDRIASAHRVAASVRDWAVGQSLLPPIILPAGGGGGGKTWP